MPQTFRVLLTDRAWPDTEIERAILGRVGAAVVEPPETSEATLAEVARECDAIGTCWAPVTATVIEAAPRCRLIARFGIGLDNIDVSAATRCGIPVTRVPDYCLAEVAEHTWALLFALARRIPLFDARAKRGDYNRLTPLPMRRLAGQKLGLIGFGPIAREVYRRAAAFGLQVAACSRTGKPYGTSCRMISLNELLAESDFVSLHCPLTEETRHLLGTEQFQRMKPTACLINTSRGGLIDTAALWRALQAGEIAGAALDVFDPEPPDLSHPLFRDERVVVTPHAAFLSADSLEELRRRAATQLAEALQNIRPEHLVNPEVWGQSASSETSPA